MTPFKWLKWLRPEGQACREWIAPRSSGYRLIGMQGESLLEGCEYKDYGKSSIISMGEWGCGVGSVVGWVSG